MSEHARELIGYLNALGITIDSSSFESRVKAQKLAYILQHILGSRLYAFNFYIKGPYSPELAKDYFEKKEDFKNGNSSYKPSKEEYGELERIKPIIGRLSVEDLEIIASLLFLEKVAGLDENKAEAELKRIKPHLRIEEIWRGNNTLKELLLTEKAREALMKPLEAEMEGWGRISNESLEKFMS